MSIFKVEKLSLVITNFPTKKSYQSYKITKYEERKNEEGEMIPVVIEELTVTKNVILNTISHINAEIVKANSNKAEHVAYLSEIEKLEV